MTERSPPIRLQRRALLAALGAAALTPLMSRAADGNEHAGAHPAGPEYRLSTVEYAVPDLAVVRDDGKTVSLSKEIDDGRPVVLNFIFTTCPGICPLMSQVFSQFQDRLGAERAKVHMVSISIDPEEDTPARLRAYAAKFSAGPQWQHYTGTVAASVAAQKAFDVYRGDKMSHDPLTLMRLAPGKPWLRIDGFATGAELSRQFAGLATIPAPNLR